VIIKYRGDGPPELNPIERSPNPIESGRVPGVETLIWVSYEELGEARTVQLAPSVACLSMRLGRGPRNQRRIQGRRTATVGESPRQRGTFRRDRFEARRRPL